MNITKDAMKAETALRRIRKHTEEAIDKVTLAWMQREADFLDKLSPEVKSVLRAAGVIGTAPPKFDETFTLDPSDTEENPAVLS